MLSVNLSRSPAGESVARPESGVAAELNKRAAARMATLDRITKQRTLRLQLADDIERLQSRKLAGISETTTLAAGSSAPGFWRRLLRLLGFTRERKTSDVEESAISTAALRQRIEESRTHLANFDPIDDPVVSTQEIATLAREALARRISEISVPDENTRLAISNANDDFQLQGITDLSRELVDLVLFHRPLWLASALGAPKRIPLKDGLFDLVIFDEASQCDIGSALPLLARARRAVIVGDDRQLAFFPQLGIAKDRNLMLAQRLPLNGMGRFAQSRKSLFDLARSTPDVPIVMLRDQYRSAADIVAYINEDFYGGKLRVAADQTELRVPKATSPGLHWTDVPAQTEKRYVRGNVNHAEIRAIVEYLEAGSLSTGLQRKYRRDLSVSLASGGVSRRHRQSNFQGASGRGEPQCRHS